ncbi:MAG: hypothetical protein ACL7BU_06850 [Candidatus Phlomobacter fragariae]
MKGTSPIFRHLATRNTAATAPPELIPQRYLIYNDSTYKTRRFDKESVSAVFLVSAYLLQEIEWQNSPQTEVSKMQLSSTKNLNAVKKYRSLRPSR